MTTAFTALLGDTLKSGDGSTISTSNALAGKKAVGLYFSAHWCPPCRGFTPKLASAYSESLSKLGLEIVFVSSDRDEASFDSYFAEQPWLALPYDQRDLKAKLSKQFKVSGIPSFVILDGETGELITADGREAVSEDPKGANFPWRPPTFWEALGTDFLNGTDGETVDVDELKGDGKYIGLYFSAHWCPPCRGFTPDLVKAYKEHLKAKSLEIIFVSSDRDAASFKEYYETMPWLAIPNGDPRKSKLSSLFNVEGIPSFVIVDAATGETVNGNARGKVSSDPSGAEFPWHPKALNELESPDGINDEPALCVMLEGCDEATISAAKAVLEPIAEAAKAAKDPMLFFYAAKTGSVTSRIRELTGLEKPAAKPSSTLEIPLLLLDIPDEGAYYLSSATEVTTQAVTAFLDAFKQKTLERKQLS